MLGSGNMLQGEWGRGQDTPGTGLPWKAVMSLSLGEPGPGSCSSLLCVLDGGTSTYCA